MVWGGSDVAVGAFEEAGLWETFGMHACCYVMKEISILFAHDFNTDPLLDLLGVLFLWVVFWEHMDVHRRRRDSILGDS